MFSFLNSRTTRILAVTLFLSALSRADLIYSDFGPSESFDISNGLELTATADEFAVQVPALEDAIILLTAAISTGSSTYPPVLLFLVPDNGGRPRRLTESLRRP
jgi:hypothetical protein